MTAGRREDLLLVASALLVVLSALPARAQTSGERASAPGGAPSGARPSAGKASSGAVATEAKGRDRSTSGSPGPSESGSTPAVNQAGQPWIVALLPPNIGGEFDGPMNSFFLTEIRAGLTASGQMVVAEDKVSSFVLRHPLWMQCNDALCFKRFFDELGAEFLVRIKVDVLGKNFDFSAKVLEPGGKVRLERKARCDICTLAEARTTARRLGMTLGRDLGLKPPRTVAPKPQCTKDDDCGKGKVCKAGKCQAAPKPKSECAKDDDCGKGKVCKAGKCQAAPRPRARPRPRPVARPKPKLALWDRPHPWGQFALVTGGVALVSLVTGAALVGIDAKPTCSRPDPTHTCPERYDTMGAGAGLLVFAGLSAAASGFFTYLWWRHRSGRKHEDKRKVSFFVAPVRGSSGTKGLAASLRWEY